MKKLLFVLLVIVCSCVSKTHELGRYLYVTDNNVLHCNQECSRIRDNNDENGHKEKGLNFILTEKFIDQGITTYCSKCFDDNLYEKAQLISHQNIQEYIYNIQEKYNSEDCPCCYGHHRVELKTDNSDSSSYKGVGYSFSDDACPGFKDYIQECVEYKLKYLFLSL